MPFEIRKPKGPAMYVSDRALCLAEDKETVVESTDVRARYLLVGAGSEIEQELAHELGLELVDGKFVTPEQRASAAAEPSEAAGGQPQA